MYISQSSTSAPYLATRIEYSIIIAFWNLQRNVSILIEQSSKIKDSCIVLYFWKLLIRSYMTRVLDYLKTEPALTYSQSEPEYQCHNNHRFQRTITVLKLDLPYRSSFPFSIFCNISRKFLQQIY